MEMKITRQTKWSLHSFKVGDIKKFPHIDLPKFRSALSIWNKNNPTDKIKYKHEIIGNNVTARRVE